MKFMKTETRKGFFFKLVRKKFQLPKQTNWLLWEKTKQVLACQNKRSLATHEQKPYDFKMQNMEFLLMNILRKYKTLLTRRQGCYFWLVSKNMIWGKPLSPSIWRRSTRWNCSRIQKCCDNFRGRNSNVWEIIIKEKWWQYDSFLLSFSFFEST